MGWHGIVPSKALPMANDIVDNVMLRLINVSQVTWHASLVRVRLGYRLINVSQVTWHAFLT